MSGHNRMKIEESKCGIAQSSATKYWILLDLCDARRLRAKDVDFFIVVLIGVVAIRMGRNGGLSQCTFKVENFNAINAI